MKATINNCFFFMLVILSCIKVFPLLVAQGCLLVDRKPLSQKHHCRLLKKCYNDPSNSSNRLIRL
jgi:hypothetical protein